MLAYLKLMLTNRIAGLKMGNLRREGRSGARVIGSYIGYALLYIMLYAMIVAFEVFLFWAASEAGEPQMVLAVMFLLCTLLSLIYGFFNVVSVLYFNRDNAFVASLPITSRGIMSAKVLSVLVGEIGLTLGVGLPLVIMYGVTSGLNALYYLRALVLMLFVPMVPISAALLLSFLLIRVSGLWKRRESLTIIVSFLLMAGMMVLQMNISMKATEDQFTASLISMIYGKTSLTNTLLGIYPPIHWLCDSLTLSGWSAWGNALLFIGLSIASLGAVVLLIGGRYLKLALKQEETLRRANAGRRTAGKDKIRTPLRALYRREMLDVITVPVYATNCLAGTVMYPIIIIVMFFSMQQNISAGLPLIQVITRAIPPTLYLTIACAIMCFTTTMGLAVATSVSREGRQHDFRRAMPVSGATQLKAKLLMGMTYNVVTVVFTAIVLWVLLPNYWLETLASTLIAQLFSMMWCILSLIVEVGHARLKWKTETEAVKQNMNSFFAMLIGLGALVVLGGAFYLCVKLGLSMELALAADVALMLLADTLLYRWLIGAGARAYTFKEYAN